jgi:hypothetical protein
MQKAIHISASGEYARDMPIELVEALRHSIIQHMKAYGLTNIFVLMNGSTTATDDEHKS